MKSVTSSLALASVVCFLSSASTVAADTARWWRGNLHTHSLWSDGDDFPEMIAEGYRTNGYHFLAFSDHNLLSQGIRWMDVDKVAARAKSEPWRASIRPRDAFASYLRRHGTNWVETRTDATTGKLQVRLKPFEEFRPLVDQAGRFLMVQAEELTQSATNGRAIHINAVHLGEQLPAQAGATVPDVLRNALRAVSESGRRTGRDILVHVNHPNYKWGVTAEDLAQVIDEQFFEVWNGVDADNDPGDVRHPSTDEIWDIANTLRLVGFNAAPLYAVATDDSHDYQGNELRAQPYRAWVMVRAFHLTPESLIRALRSGDFYASTGVLLDDIRFDATSRTLELRIEPRRGEKFVTRFIGTRRGVGIDGRPRRDANGVVVDTTLDYRTGSRPQIGEVLAEVSGSRPRYQFRGDELYVRAVVTSTGRPLVPSTEFEFKRAWTQPVGWNPPVPAAPATPPGR